MSKITLEDLKRIDEPCKSCELYAEGSGKNKKFYCKVKNARLMDNPRFKTVSQLIDCPKRMKK